MNATVEKEFDTSRGRPSDHKLISGGINLPDELGASRRTNFRMSS